ncbi:protein SEC13 homolog [Tigriopus californicus]|nr:protein SEC13 homolog [Tigriopus californicus]|eukprot:TCALIF_07471-PA protein Name:"Similar to SEC13 Protein SEC13 homolog (Bos taurus)" AED:0.07 eAED:0.10 QI:25/0/0/1/0.5/0.33/3/0/325
MVSLESTVDTGHDEMIHDAAMDYYGRKLATCSSDRSVKIFEMSENGVQTLVADLKGHEGPVWQVGWANPKYGTILASCSYDRKVILWREDSPGRWNRLYEYTGHDSSVNSVSWAPHELGLALACGSSDGAISILTYIDSANNWKAEKIPNAHTIGCNAVSWAPYLFQQTERRFVSGGCDNLVKIWKYDHKESKWVEECKLEAHSDWVRDVAWAPSLGVNRSVIASCSQDRRVIIWSNDGGVGSTSWTPRTLNTFDDVVWHVSWSVSGNMLAVSGGDNKVTLWKETLDSQWVNISDVSKGQGASQSSGPAQTGTGPPLPVAAVGSS